MPGRRRARRAFSASALLLSVACQDEPAPESPPAPPPEVAYSGCLELLTGPVCGVAEDSELVVWVDAPPERVVEARAGGQVLAAEAAGVEGGRATVWRRPRRRGGWSSASRAGLAASGGWSWP